MMAMRSSIPVWWISCVPRVACQGTAASFFLLVSTWSNTFFGTIGCFHQPAPYFFCITRVTSSRSEFSKTYVNGYTLAIRATSAETCLGRIGSSIANRAPSTTISFNRVSVLARGRLPFPAAAAASRRAAMIARTRPRSGSTRYWWSLIPCSSASTAYVSSRDIGPHRFRAALASRCRRRRSVFPSFATRAARSADLLGGRGIVGPLLRPRGRFHRLALELMACYAHGVRGCPDDRRDLWIGQRRPAEQLDRVHLLHVLRHRDRNQGRQPLDGREEIVIRVRRAHRSASAGAFVPPEFRRAPRPPRRDSATRTLTTFSVVLHTAAIVERSTPRRWSSGARSAIVRSLPTCAARSRLIVASVSRTSLIVRSSVIIRSRALRCKTVWRRATTGSLLRVNAYAQGTKLGFFCT